MAREYVDQVAGALIEQLNAGTAPWVKPWQPGSRFMPYNPTTGNAYHGMNAVWLMSLAESRGYTDARWMTYRQAHAADAQVRKGEKGAVIQFWKWEGLEPVRNIDGERVLSQDGNQVLQAVRFERPRVWSAVVFNAEQIDGLARATNRPTLRAWQRHGRAEQILARFDATIHHVRGDHAFYRLADDAITLPARGQFASADGYYATALHEVGHATGHPSRLNRKDLGHPFGSDAYAREELRAEIASLMLGEQLGIGYDPGQHNAYIGSWIRALENDPREIFRAAADAEKIVVLVRSFERERGQEAVHANVPDQPVPERGKGRLTDASVPVRSAVLIAENHPAMTASSDRTYLVVPYAEHDAVRQLGAQWDRRTKAWYVPPGADVEVFTAWLTSRDSVRIAVDIDPADQFAEALRSCALRPDGPVHMDGQMHRVPVEGDKGNERSGAYVGYLDQRPAGFIQNFKTGVKTTWKASGKVAALDSEDRRRVAAEATQRQHERTLERDRQYERAARQAEAIWMAATPIAAHPYLTEKGVPSHGLRQGTDGQTITAQDRDGIEYAVSIAGRLLVPVEDPRGTMMSLQFIDAAGTKMFLPKGRVESGHFVIGDLGKPGPLLIAEGYATAATLYELTDIPVIVAFNAGNLAPVAETLRQLQPDRIIYIAGDNDHQQEARGKPNVGRAKAAEAAAAIGGFVLLPVFTEQDTGSDWNDLLRGKGSDAARQQLRNGFAVAERERMALNPVVSDDQNPHRSHTSAPVRIRDSEQQRDVER
jgi:putative DNA primase/helicase